MTEEQHVLTVMEKARKELAEFCNACLIVVSFDVGENDALLTKGVGSTSQIMGLAKFAQFEVEETWSTQPHEQKPD